MAIYGCGILYGHLWLCSMAVEPSMAMEPSMAVESSLFTCMAICVLIYIASTSLLHCIVSTDLYSADDVIRMMSSG